MTVTISAIDKSASSVSFTGPNGWKYERRVVDPTVLDKLKVGDLVDITWDTNVTVAVQYLYRRENNDLALKDALLCGVSDRVGRSGSVHRCRSPDARYGAASTATPRGRRTPVRAARRSASTKSACAKTVANKLISLFQFLADLTGGTDETLSGDLRVARGYRVRSATASAAGHDQPAAPSAGPPAAAEVTPTSICRGGSAGLLPRARRRRCRRALCAIAARLASRRSRMRCNCRRPLRFSKDRWSGGNRRSKRSGWDGLDWAVGRYSIADIHLFRLYWRLRGGDITNSGAHDQRKGSQWRSRE